MQLPNKLYSFQESTLGKLPKLLRMLEPKPVPVKTLYFMLKDGDGLDAADFLSLLDCAYALNAVDINKDEEAYLCL